jgi:predicted DCC family thiol-disulfide oxidoreductase YuxK
MFFDGACPLCRREVAHYQRLDRAGAIRWVDISRERAELDAAGIPYAHAMARLHAVDGDGQVLSGVPAFLAIWRHLPYYRRLGRVIESLRLVSLLEAAYRRFAARRLRSRCAAGACMPER